MKTTPYTILVKQKRLTFVLYALLVAALWACAIYTGVHKDLVTDKWRGLLFFTAGLITVIPPFFLWGRLQESKDLCRIYDDIIKEIECGLYQEHWTYDLKALEAEVLNREGMSLFDILWRPLLRTLVGFVFLYILVAADEFTVMFPAFFLAYLLYKGLLFLSAVLLPTGTPDPKHIEVYWGNGYLLEGDFLFLWQPKLERVQLLGVEFEEDYPAFLTFTTKTRVRAHRQPIGQDHYNSHSVHVPPEVKIIGGLSFGDDLDEHDEHDATDALDLLFDDGPPLQLSGNFDADFADKGDGPPAPLGPLPRFSLAPHPSPVAAPFPPLPPLSSTPSALPPLSPSPSVASEQQAPTNPAPLGPLPRSSLGPLPASPPNTAQQAPQGEGPVDPLDLAPPRILQKRQPPKLEPTIKARIQLGRFLMLFSFPLGCILGYSCYTHQESSAQATEARTLLQKCRQQARVSYCEELLRTYPKTTLRKQAQQLLFTLYKQNLQAPYTAYKYLQPHVTPNFTLLPPAKQQALKTILRKTALPRLRALYIKAMLWNRRWPRAQQTILDEAVKTLGIDEGKKLLARYRRIEKEQNTLRLLRKSSKPSKARKR